MESFCLQSALNGSSLKTQDGIEVFHFIKNHSPVYNEYPFSAIICGVIQTPKCFNIYGVSKDGLTKLFNYANR